MCVCVHACVCKCYNCNNKTVLIKHYIEIAFNSSRKKVMVSVIRKTKIYFGIVIFWLGGKNCIVKVE